MAPLDLILVRHGEIDSNLRKVYSGRSMEPLNARGSAQAHEAGRALKGLAVQGIVSSPLRRATQTADILAEHLASQVVACAAFTELGMGPWEGLSEAAVAEDFPAEWAIWNTMPADLVLPDRETLADVQARIADGLNWIRERFPTDAPLVLVSHVAILRVLLLTSQAKALNAYKTIHVANATPMRLTIA